MRIVLLLFFFLVVMQFSALVTKTWANTVVK